MTPDEDEAVRRLLAEAGEERPVTPPDVVARLDDVLAGLVADRAAEADPAAPEVGPGEADESGEPAPAVADLSARRRRVWPKVLVAAAAVSVLGLGVGNVLSGGGSMNETASAGRAAEGAGPDVEDDAEAAPAPSSAERGNADRALLQVPAAVGALPRLRTGSLTADAQRLADFGLTTSVTDGVPRTSDREQPVKPAPGCQDPAARAGDELLLVRLDGVRSVLVLRAPDHGERTAEVFHCSDASAPVARTTVEDR